MTWGEAYITPEVTPEPLEPGTRVYIHTQHLVPTVDRRFGRVLRYDRGNVQVEVEPGRGRGPETCWLYPWDIQAVEEKIA